MLKFFGRKTTIVVVLVIILLISRFSFFASVRDTTRIGLGVPAQAVSQITSRVSNSFKVFFTVQDLARENNQLKGELSQLQAKIAGLSHAQGENEQLKKDLAFRQSRPDLNLLPATVINYSPTSLYQAVAINRGSSDGLEAGQAVVAHGFLVGKISQVSEKTAEIWLLSNRNLITPVTLTETQTVGLLKGSIRGLVVENIPLDTKVEKGSPVVTSSLEGLYPAGIAVGLVEEIISAKEEIFLTLRIATLINPSNLTTVSVVTSQ